MITWTDVTNLDPSLSTVPPATQAAILALVQKLIHSCPWGDKYDYALALLAAHIATMYLRNATGATGAVVKEKVGGVERQYGTFTGSGAPDLDQTWFGQIYKMLLRGLLGSRGPLVT